MISIVTHCVGGFYPRLLCYQLTSLIDQDDCVPTVVHSLLDDPTQSVLNFFRDRARVDSIGLEPNEVCRRAIGRNMAARENISDWIFFADADYVFAPGAMVKLLETLNGLPDGVVLAYPRSVMASATHEAGENMIRRVNPPQLATLLSSDRFEPMKYSKAIGGCQIVRGAWAREHGYLPSDGWQTPPTKAEWQETREDVAFRRQVGNKGVAIDVQGIYRIRHRRPGKWVM